MIGAAEAMCTRSESKWARRDEFQLRSMAQTRAIARALRAPLAPIVALSEYGPSVAEELIDVTPVLDHMPSTPPPTRGAKAPEPDITGAARRRDPLPDEIKPTGDQVDELLRLLDELRASWPEIDWKARAKVRRDVGRHAHRRDDGDPPRQAQARARGVARGVTMGGSSPPVSSPTGSTPLDRRAAAVDEGRQGSGGEASVRARSATSPSRSTRGSLELDNGGRRDRGSVTRPGRRPPRGSILRRVTRPAAMPD